MNYHVLWSELRDDPLHMGYETMTDDAVVAVLSAATIPAVGPISVLTALRWAAQVGAIPKLRAAAAAGGAIGGVAEVVLALLNAQDTEIDLNDGEVAAMFGALVEAGVFSTGDQHAFVMRATRLISRAQQLGLNGITVTDVHNARVWGPELERAS